jgi:hypothetical protein
MMKKRFGSADSVLRTIKNFGRQKFRRWAGFFMTWTVMIDESGTDNHSSIMAMAALLAVDSRWAMLEAEWKAMHARHGLARIHCSELRRDLNYDDGRLAAVMEEVEAIIIRHIPLSVVAVMRKDDYDGIYKPTRPVSGIKHGPLGVLYRACMSFFAAFLEDYPPSNLDLVRFVYERGPKEGGLKSIHAAFQAADGVEDWFGPLSFMAKGERVALQAADCLAAGALFHERQQHTAGRSDISDSSLVITGSTPTSLDAPVSFRLPVTRAIIKTLRDDLLLTRTQRAALARSIVQAGDRAR